MDVSNQSLAQLSILYALGDKVKPDMAAARRYALRGAAQCDVMSMVLVAMTYPLNNAANMVQAYAWATVATQRGKGSPPLANTMRIANDIKQKTKGMGSEQIAKAETLAHSLPICLSFEQRKSKQH
jgi:hypothetical protein